ncbi:hypothetical protein R3P38DRAFT_2812253 [Favolaschia claudopus]|uniref:Uncharacterized protein n=1 Tax=Favolaschia claudopus TaxID=2862362 RepID=A0AAV9Z6N8_9AGAR
MLTAAILFILVNIPLSAYETVQESTYFPNSSVPAPPLSALVPSSLRLSTNQFSPQHLDVGQSFRLNNSALSYNITNAFDSVENERQVTSFPYYNNPFSQGCDVPTQSRKISPRSCISVWGSRQYHISTTTTPPLSGALDSGLSVATIGFPLYHFGRDLLTVHHREQQLIMDSWGIQASPQMCSRDKVLSQLPPGHAAHAVRTRPPWRKIDPSSPANLAVRNQVGLSAWK